jgi:CLIP-associating protein 1/2
MAGDQGVFGTSPSGGSSSVGSTTAFPVRRGGSPAITLNSSRPTSKGSVTQSTAPPFEDEENFTMVLPQAHRAPAPTAVTRGREVGGPSTRSSPGHQRGGLGQTMSVDNGILAMTPTAEDGLTLAHHASHFAQSTESSGGRIDRQRSPLAYRSPMRAMFDEARERTGK